MNKYVVNVRGINASGKSTAVRLFCRAFSLQPEVLEFGGQKYRVMTDGKKIAVGWYRPYSVAEGCDALKAGKEDFKRFLEYLLKERKPEIVVYEKQIWSTTYKLTKEIAGITEQSGYQFIAIHMKIRYEVALNRLFFRNGGNLTNLDNFDNRFYQVQCARKNMKKNRIVVFDADVEKIPKEKMDWCIIEAIRLFDEGERGGEISGGLVQDTE